MGSRSWKGSRKSRINSEDALATRFLVEPEENGFYMVQFEGFPGKSRRAGWVQQEARELPGVRQTGASQRQE